MLFYAKKGSRKIGAAVGMAALFLTAVGFCWGQTNAPTNAKAPVKVTVEPLHTLTRKEAASPSGLTRGGDGFLYGTGLYGGPNNTGAVFKLRSDGSEFGLLHSFSAEISNDPSNYRMGEVHNAGGTQPTGALVWGGDHYLYGTARAGGPGNTGTLFRVGTDGQHFQLLHNFSALSSGQDSTKTAANQVRCNEDGAWPDGLIGGTDGFLYGTASEGGINGRGTVFKIKRDGSGFHVIHAFGTVEEDLSNSDGSRPSSGLLLAKDGLLYGVVSFGGANAGGTIFCLAPDGSRFRTLCSFQSFQHNRDGIEPEGKLISPGDGYLYGTAPKGGSGGGGTIFRVALTGHNFQVLHSYTNNNTAPIYHDGAYPRGGLTLGKDGFLYGTTKEGGFVETGIAWGTLFRLRPDGTQFEVLVRYGEPLNAAGDFLSAPDGIIAGGNGVFYGVGSVGDSVTICRFTLTSLPKSTG